MPEGEAIFGITSLAGEIYVLRWKGRDQVEVYDIITYCLQRCFTVPNFQAFNDIHHVNITVVCTLVIILLNVYID